MLVIVRTSSSFPAAYALEVLPSHHTGARTYATSEASPYGSSSRAGWPVAAIDLASCVSSSSSVKTVGTGRRDACHEYTAASAK